jgi:hypothetical protein
MDVIQHHAPSKLAVTLGLEEHKRARYPIGNLWLGQIARSYSGIQVILNSLRKQFVEPFQLSRSDLAALALGGQQDVLALELILRQDPLRKRIAQSQGHKIRGAFRFPVWQTATVTDRNRAKSGLKPLGKWREHWR